MSGRAFESERVVPVRRVLLIDDQPSASEALEVWLGFQGIEVRIATNGADALESLTAFTPDVALVDIGLPDLDGYTLASRLRERLGGGTRLIALSGHPDPKSRESSASPFALHLRKPVNLTELKRHLSL